MYVQKKWLRDQKDLNVLKDNLVEKIGLAELGTFTGIKGKKQGVSSLEKGADNSGCVQRCH